VRRAAGAEAARLLADLVIEGARTLAFVRSRRGAELTTLTAQRHLSEAGAAALVPRIAAYRAGYLPEERRALEAALSSGRLLGVASTNALELGLDVSGLDAVVVAGFPGTLASLWQQAGRAGRSGAAALVLFVARDDPLDTYLVHHPEAVFGRPIEASVFDPQNPYVLGPQLCCAAAELPLRAEDLGSFGESAPAVLDQLVAQGLLRRRPSGWYWTSRDRPAADIRGSGGPPVTVVEKSDGSLIGTVDAAAAHGTVHDGAVYLHQGRSYVVDSFDVEDAVALVHAEEPDWSTTARDLTDIAIVATTTVTQHGPISVAFGTVDVTNQTVSYERRRISTNEIIDETPLDLPPRELRTRAVWYCIPQDALDAIELFARDVPGAAHAAEHAAIGLLPLFATCDRWDIGGVSTGLHPDTGTPTVFVYDGAAGGAGFAERGHAALRPWLQATREAISACECVSGCPSCVQSPKCGNGNEPLDKPGAVRLLDLVLRHLGRS
jgi:DEAD/DEAH box helicase domain-containing protein